jgi:hypothetical protein
VPQRRARTACIITTTITAATTTPTAIGSARVVSTRTIGNKVERARRWRLSPLLRRLIGLARAHDQLQRPLTRAMTIGRGVCARRGNSHSDSHAQAFRQLETRRDEYADRSLDENGTDRNCCFLDGDRVEITFRRCQPCSNGHVREQQLGPMLHN